MIEDLPNCASPSLKFFKSIFRTFSKWTVELFCKIRKKNHWFFTIDVFNIGKIYGNENLYMTYNSFPGKLNVFYEPSPIYTFQ